MAIIYLIGARASGKTTVGKLLATELAWQHIDTDQVLSETLQCSVADYVQQQGWEAFRQAESAVLRQIVHEAERHGKNIVVSTGGGLILAEDNRTLMRQTGRIFYLATTPEVLIQRLTADPQIAQRPSLTGKSLAEEVQEIVSVRSPLYAQCAQEQFDAALAPQNICQQMLHCCKQKRGQNMRVMDAETYLKKLLLAPRPGKDKFLAFYDQRVGGICTDPAFFLIPLDDHLCHRGDGLFESLCFREKKIFALDAHLARMQDGAKTLALVPPCSWEEIRTLILDVARAAQQDHGDLRVFLSRGPGGFGINPKECPTAGLYIVALSKALPAPEIYLKGLTAFSSTIPPKQKYLATIKSTNYLPNVFMATEAEQKGLDVAVSFDAEGFLAEAAIANIAIVNQAGQLVSPELTSILPGTTLLAALKLATEKMPVVQRPIPHSELVQAREILLFTSSALCIGVTHFDGQPVGYGEQAGRPGEVALWLKDRLLDYMLETGVAI